MKVLVEADQLTRLHGQVEALRHQLAREQQVTALALTYAEVGRRLSCSERTVRRIVTDGAIPTVQVAGSPRIRTSDLLRYVNGLPTRRSRRIVAAQAS